MNYLIWRLSSFNEEALLFSLLVYIAECLTFFGTCLFFFDIWREGDTKNQIACKFDHRHNSEKVEIFITTFDEPLEVVEPSIQAAKLVEVPIGFEATVCVLDDGNRDEMRELAEGYGVGYRTRSNNVGFKAGNLSSALLQSEAGFVTICDADTRLFPNFLTSTLGYFADPKVAWVQTPHWFYDIPDGSWNFRTDMKRLAIALFRNRGKGVTKRSHAMRDPYLSDPAMFFDVIQRRRNRNGASFCCGAGSVHRKSALFDAHISRVSEVNLSEGRGFEYPNYSASLQAAELFRHHVSEDLKTSIDLHALGWKSVYHPEVLSKMLSPWSLDAWATQRLKYAGGTLDIVIRGNAIFRPGLGIKQRLHYWATFWSYLSCIWIPVLLIAPIISLITGMAPVSSFSLELYANLIPVLVLTELCLILASKEHDYWRARVGNLVTLPIQIKAFMSVVSGKEPKFPPTPKIPNLRASLSYVRAHIWFVFITILALCVGLCQTVNLAPTHTVQLFLPSALWAVWNVVPFVFIIAAGLNPPLVGEDE